MANPESIRDRADSGRHEPGLDVGPDPREAHEQDSRVQEAPAINEIPEILVGCQEDAVGLQAPI
jgi:hypothetical protein